jgi:hypothetical protein
MSSNVIYGYFWRWKAGISESADSYSNRIDLTLFLVEQIGSTGWAERKNKPAALIACPYELRGRPDNLERRGKACQCGEGRAGTLLTGEAVANADAKQLATEPDLKLLARTRRYPHRSTPFLCGAGPAGCTAAYEHVL